MDGGHCTRESMDSDMEPYVGFRNQELLDSEKKMQEWALLDSSESMLAEHQERNKPC